MRRPPKPKIAGSSPVRRCVDHMVRFFFVKLLRKGYLIIGRGWAEYRDLSEARRSIICRSRRLRQIIDLRDTDKSRYFAITEFNNCFIIRTSSLFSYFNHFLAARGSDLLFFSREHDSNYAWAEYYLQNTFKRSILRFLWRATKEERKIRFRVLSDLIQSCFFLKKTHPEDSTQFENYFICSPKPAEFPVHRR